MSNKISYASVIADVLNGEPLTNERIEKLTALKASLEKRATRKAGPTKVQLANAAIGDEIMATLTAGEVYTISDVANAVPSLAGATPQKVGPILRHLRDAGKLTEIKVKGKPAYSIAE